VTPEVEVQELGRVLDLESPEPQFPDARVSDEATAPVGRPGPVSPLDQQHPHPQTDPQLPESGPDLHRELALDESIVAPPSGLLHH
jgi:hypothetical protein